MISSFYLWKWADNDLPGRPSEVSAALLHGELPPALQAFDPRPLLKTLEQAAAAGRERGEEWDWVLAPDVAEDLVPFVFVTCPELEVSKAAAEDEGSFISSLAQLGLSGCEEGNSRLLPGLLPKLNCFEGGQMVPAYDVALEDLPSIIRSIDGREKDSFGILSLRDSSKFVQCYVHGQRYVVEWAHNETQEGKMVFDHWRAQDRERLATLDVPYDKDTPSDKDPDLLLFADTLRIFESFLRGEPRPERYHWMNVNSWLKK